MESWDKDINWKLIPPGWNVLLLGSERIATPPYYKWSIGGSPKLIYPSDVMKEVSTSKLLIPIELSPIIKSVKNQNANLLLPLLDASNGHLFLPAFKKARTLFPNAGAGTEETIIERVKKIDIFNLLDKPLKNPNGESLFVPGWQKPIYSRLQKG